MFNTVRAAFSAVIFVCILVSFANADINDDVRSIRRVVSSISYKLNNEFPTLEEMKCFGETLSEVGVSINRMQHVVKKYDNDKLNSDLKTVRTVISSCSYKLREETPKNLQEQKKVAEHLNSIGTVLIRIQNRLNRLSK